MVSRWGRAVGARTSRSARWRPRPEISGQPRRAGALRSGGSARDAPNVGTSGSQKSIVDTRFGFWCHHPPFWDNAMYAVLETGGKQYRVTSGDTLEVERLAVEAGQPFIFERVLLVNNAGQVTIGSPTVPTA